MMTMNGIRAQGGLSGTTRGPQPTQGYTPSYGNALPGTQAPQPMALGRAGGPTPQAGMGLAGSTASHYAQARMQPGMMNTGMQAPRQQPQLPPQQAPQFDPNDPNNAALFGYMNG